MKGPIVYMTDTIDVSHLHWTVNNSNNNLLPAWILLVVIYNFCSFGSNKAAPHYYLHYMYLLYILCKYNNINNFDGSENVSITNKFVLDRFYL